MEEIKLSRFGKERPYTSFSRGLSHFGKLYGVPLTRRSGNCELIAPAILAAWLRQPSAFAKKILMAFVWRGDGGGFN